LCLLLSVNNEDSVNLRVLTEAAITNTNERAKQAQVDGIQLDGGQQAHQPASTVKAKGNAATARRKSIISLCCSLCLSLFRFFVSFVQVM
jgi:hypothetical protein